MNQKLKIWTSEQVERMNSKDLVIEMLDMLGISPSIPASDSEIEQIKHKLTMVEASMGISISRY